MRTSSPASNGSACSSGRLRSPSLSASASSGRSVASEGVRQALTTGPVHVHGLGINPADGALFIATHTGLWRSGLGESKSVRVGDNNQDTMGFTVIGRDRFLGSGHPDFRTDLPPLLGLIESNDGGRSWEPISLLGQADFHVLRSAGEPRIWLRRLERSAACE